MFKNFGNLTQLAGMLKDAGNIREKIAQIKTKLAADRFKQSADGERVVVEMNAAGEVLDVVIAPEMLTPQMQHELQQQLVIALNKAGKTAKEKHVAAIREATKGLPIPGLDGVLQEMAS